MKQMLALILTGMLLAAAMTNNVFEEEAVSFKGNKQHMERLLACWMTLREFEPI